MANEAALLAALRQYAIGQNKPLFDEAFRRIQKDLIQLASEDLLRLGPDYSLSGVPLEIRTKQLFKSMGFKISDGRPGLEDFVVDPPSDSSIADRVILEVKSSRKPQIERDDLRQLDDWIFDLSGEEGARKRGLPVGVSAIVTGGFGVSPRKHSSPHKGVLVFNGPINTPFEERAQTCLGQNDNDFVNKRNFCILPLADLISYSVTVQRGKKRSIEFWELLHSACGLFQLVPGKTA